MPAGLAASPILPEDESHVVTEGPIAERFPRGTIIKLPLHGADIFRLSWELPAQALKYAVGFGVRPNGGANPYPLIRPFLTIEPPQWKWLEHIEIWELLFFLDHKGQIVRKWEASPHTKAARFGSGIIVVLEQPQTPPAYLVRYRWSGDTTAYPPALLQAGIQPPDTQNA